MVYSEMASTLWAAQPRSEKAIENRVCAGCETEDASLVCSRCRCTRYCSKQCQKTHWTEGGHKKYCSLDPLYHLTSVPVPKYREYTMCETIKEHPVYILRTGSLTGKKSTIEILTAKWSFLLILTSLIVVIDFLDKTTRRRMKSCEV